MASSIKRRRRCVHSTWPQKSGARQHSERGAGVDGSVARDLLFVLFRKVVFLFDPLVESVSEGDNFFDQVVESVFEVDIFFD